MDTDSKKFEKLTAEIFAQLQGKQEYTSIEHDVKLPGKYGPRQIDVLIRGKIGPIEILTIIECKDINKNLSISYIDELDSKMKDVSAHKAIIVARKGFSKNALKKARALGISCCKVQDMRSGKWNIDIELPLLIIEYTPIKIGPSATFSLYRTSNFKFDSLFHVNDINIFDIFVHEWNSGKVKFDENTLDRQLLWKFDHIVKPPYYMKTSDGEKIPISDFKIKYFVEINHYLGYINKFESAKLLNFLMEEKKHITFNIDELNFYQQKFELIKDINKIRDRKLFTIKYQAYSHLSNYQHLNEISITKLL
jgi:hypothetical protein